MRNTMRQFADRDRQKAFQIALQWVKAKAGQVQFVKRFRAIQDEKDILGLLYEVRPNTSPVPVFEKPF
jgi:hypothetical protein